VEWRIEPGLTSYDDALAFMDKRADAIAAGEAPEFVWLVEHAPLYTAGTGTSTEDLSGTDRFPVHTVGRGGRLTYHGPGQRVVYPMLNLKERGSDVRRYVVTLEEWIIRTLAHFDVKGERRDDRVGVWVRRPEKGEGFEDKIAALGIRVKRWVTMHGISINVAPDLSHFSGILACGISERRYGVTSLKDLGVKASMTDVDRALRRTFEELFGAIEISPVIPEAERSEGCPGSRIVGVSGSRVSR
jgi:lipoyl(octanoyl) transferase